MVQFCGRIQEINHQYNVNNVMYNEVQGIVEGKLHDQHEPN